MFLRLLRRFAGARGGTGAQRGSALADHDADVADTLREADEQFAAGQTDIAAELYGRVLGVRPNDPEALCGLGITRAQAGDLAGAHALLERAAAQLPDRADVFHSLGKVEHERGDLHAARAAFLKAAALEKRSARNLSSLARLEREMGEVQQACEHLRLAVALRPNDAGLYAELAATCDDCGLFAEARSALESALRIDPAHAAARLARAFERLRAADFASGWIDYEARFETDEWSGWRAYQSPRWRGEPLARRRILLVGEQGLGDQIMFASCIPELLREAAQCTVACDSRLVGLFRRSFAQASVIVDDARQPAVAPDEGFDFHIPMGSVPALRRVRLDQFPAHDGYLAADPERVSEFRARLRAMGTGPVIGLSWRGGLPRTRRALRSIALPDLVAALRLPSEAVLVSLQYGDCEAEIDEAYRSLGIRVHHWPQAHADYDATAALVRALDATVSVCTSVVHLAGALGCPVWVLVPVTAEWRYLASGAAMPWYPSVRLLRQPAPGQWSGALEALRATLAARFNGQPGTPIRDPQG